MEKPRTPAGSCWNLSRAALEARLSLAVRLPAAGLRFRRELRLRRNESVVYVEERVTNERAQDHFFHWTQHVTLGLPLLHPDESVIALPGTRALTWPHGYEGASLVRDNEEFTWPEAPAIEGGNGKSRASVCTRRQRLCRSSVARPTARTRICGGTELATRTLARLLFSPLRLSLGRHLGRERCSHRVRPGMERRAPAVWSLVRPRCRLEKKTRLRADRCSTRPRSGEFPQNRSCELRMSLFSPKSVPDGARSVTFRSARDKIVVTEERGRAIGVAGHRPQEIGIGAGGDDFP